MITWLLRKWRDRPDPAAIMQTPPTQTERYDYAKAKLGYLRSRTQTATGRKFPSPRKGNVMEIAERRQAR